MLIKRKLKEMKELLHEDSIANIPQPKIDTLIDPNEPIEINDYEENDDDDEDEF